MIASDLTALAALMEAVAAAEMAQGFFLSGTVTAKDSDGTEAALTFHDGGEPTMETV